MGYFFFSAGLPRLHNWIYDKFLNLEWLSVIGKFKLRLETFHFLRNKYVRLQTQN